MGNVSRVIHNRDVTGLELLRQDVGGDNYWCMVLDKYTRQLWSGVILYALVWLVWCKVPWYSEEGI